MRRTRGSNSVMKAALSQSLSAASNFIIFLALGRAGGAREVGQFALAFVAYNAVLGLQRAMITDALLARPMQDLKGSAPSERRAITSSLILSVAAGTVVLLVGLLTPFHQLAVLAPLLPALLLEDLFRFMFFRRMRPGLAVACDAVWVAASCIGFVRLQSTPSITAAITIWGLGGLAAAMTGMLLARIGLAPVRESLRWWKRQLWPSSRWLTLESLFFHADQELTAFGFTAVAGATVFGQWQIAQSLLGLAVFVNAGLSIVSVTHLSRHNSDRRTAILASILSAAFVLVVTATLFAASSPLLRLLYGHRVTVPLTTIVGTGLILIMGAAATGPVALLRARRDERTLPLARGVALVLFTPAAVAVASRSFPAALFVLAGGGLTYLLIVARAAFRRTEVVVHLPQQQMEVVRELIA